MMEKWETKKKKKKKCEKEKGQVMRVFKEGGDLERQMVAELAAKKLDAFVEGNGLEFERERL